jgi:hypothetical protein
MNGIGIIIVKFGPVLHNLTVALDIRFENKIDLNYEMDLFGYSKRIPSGHVI